MPCIYATFLAIRKGSLWSSQAVENTHAIPIPMKTCLLCGIASHTIPLYVASLRLSNLISWGAHNSLLAI